MQGSSVKTCFLQAGTYTGLSTCNFNTNTGVSVTAYVCRTSSDDGEVWAAFPGEYAVLDGEATAWDNGVFVPFESNGTSNNTIQGLTMQHFAGGGPYEYQPVNLTIEDNVIQEMYNNGGTNGEYVAQGPGGCTYVLNWWSNVNISHNLCQNLAGYGITTNSGTQGTNGYSMSLTYDNNIVSNVCTDASDCGGIYTGWYPWGNTIDLGANLVHVTDNLIRNVGSANTSGACIYLDIQSSGVTATGNVCSGVYTWAVEYDLGTNNTLSNNIFDISALAPTWSNDGSENNTVWFDTFVSCGNQGCAQQGSATFTGNVIYNGNESSGPPDYMGIYYGSASSYVTSPVMGTNWYWTATGSFSNSPYCWANATLASGNSGVCDSSGVTEDPLFVDASANTPAGYQLQASSPVLAAGFSQIVQTQGPR
jgi:hypothetical protein